MTEKIIRQPLSLDEYDKYDIAHYNQAFKIEISQIQLEDINRLENKLEDQRVKIVRSSVTASSSGGYQLLIIGIDSTASIKSH